MRNLDADFLGAVRDSSFDAMREFGAAGLADAMACLDTRGAAEREIQHSLRMEMGLGAQLHALSESTSLLSALEAAQARVNMALDAPLGAAGLLQEINELAAARVNPCMEAMVALEAEAQACAALEAQFENAQASVRASLHGSLGTAADFQDPLEASFAGACLRLDYALASEAGMREAVGLQASLEAAHGRVLASLSAPLAMRSELEDLVALSFGGASQHVAREMALAEEMMSATGRLQAELEAAEERVRTTLAPAILAVERLESLGRAEMGGRSYEMQDRFGRNPGELALNTAPASVVSRPRTTRVTLSTSCSLCGSVLIAQQTFTCDAGSDIEIRQAVLPACVECARRQGEDPDYLRNALDPPQPAFHVIDGNAEAQSDGAKGDLRLVDDEPKDEHDTGEADEPE